MRRSTVLTALAVTATSLVLAAPADAMPADGPTGHDRAAKLTCYAGVAGVDSNRRVVYYSLKNGKVTDITRSKGKLGFPVDAWGFFDADETKGGGRTLTLDAVTPSGTPRQVTITQEKSGRITKLASRALDQDGFEPDLFAEGYGYFAYTLEGSKLFRYSLNKLPSGKIRYGSRTKLAAGYADLTSLQVATIEKVKGVAKEIVYGTTAEGALLQMQVPLKKPGKLKVRRLADTGYAGVTELVWSACDDDYDPFELVAIDPKAGVATWTTIVDPVGKARTTLRGEVTGGKGWDLTASY